MSPTVIMIIGVLLLVGALIGVLVLHSRNSSSSKPATSKCGAFDDKKPDSFAGSVCSSQANYAACTKGKKDAAAYKDACCASGTGPQTKEHACVSKDAWDACSSQTWDNKAPTYAGSCCGGIENWKVGDPMDIPRDCCTGDNKSLPYCAPKPVTSKCGTFDDTNPSSFAGSVCSSQANYGVCTKDQKDAPSYKDTCCASGAGSSLKVPACISKDAWDACGSTLWPGKPTTYDTACCTGIDDWKAGDATRYPSDCCTSDTQNLPYCKNPPK